MSDWEFLCGNCITQDYLMQEIESKEVHPCSFCETEAPCIDFDELVERVREVLATHYDEGQDVKKFDDWDDDKGYWGKTGSETVEIISELVLCDDTSIAEAIYDALGDDSDYKNPREYPEFLEEKEYGFQDWVYPQQWRDFKETLLHKERFFIDPKSSVLEQVFSGLQEKAKEQGVPLVVTLQPGETVWRARD